MAQSLYERIGGESAVTATVAKLYGKLLDDPVLAAFFEDIDVAKLRLSQSAFVTYAFGGPNDYTGRSMRTAHAEAVKDGLDDIHFDRVAHHLQTAMQELNVSDDLIKEALAIVATTRDDVLNR